MEPQQTTPQSSDPSSPKATNGGTKNIGIGIAVVALIALAAVVFGANKKPDDNSAATDTTPTDQIAAPVTSAPQESLNPGTTGSTSSASGQTYKDGTYTATGSYQSPGGLDHLGVTVTLKNDIVTAATVTAAAGDNTSKYYQDMFISNYKPLVIGKSITSVKLSKVSGSSLTSRGFNDAVAQIEAQAKA